MNLRTMTLLTAACLVSACEPFSELNGTTVSMSGAGIVLDQPLEPYGPRALARLIYATAPRWSSTESPKVEAAPLAQTAFSRDPRDPELDDAIGWFSRHLYNVATTGTTPTLPERQTRMRDARNEIQGMLFVASTNRCNKYKLMLRERSTNVSLALGSLATGLGAAGAIFTNATSQILAGAAGGISGINAEYSKNIMSNMTSAVIIPGIEKQRGAIAQEIANRRCLGIGSYTLSQALADAVRFHAACSTDVGVAAAGAALSQSHHVTLADAKATIEAVKALQKSLAGSGGATGQTGATVQASPPRTAEDNNQNPKSALLLGDPINFLQCPELDDKGMLPNEASPSVGANAGITGQVPFGVMKKN